MAYSTLSIQQLRQRKHWIFDMDGTLTLANHDFDAIRDTLGLPPQLPILESLAKLPKAEAARLNQQLDEIELDIAQQSKPAHGAYEALSFLQQQGITMGILTRNNLVNIHATLKAAGLDGFFKEEDLISRDCAAPKPHPEGILRLLNQWQTSADDAVMVGDYLFDLETGRAANTATLYIDTQGLFPFKDYADVCIRQLDELLYEND